MMPDMMPGMMHYDMNDMNMMHDMMPGQQMRAPPQGLMPGMMPEQQMRRPGQGGVPQQRMVKRLGAQGMMQQQMPPPPQYGMPPQQNMMPTEQMQRGAGQLDSGDVAQVLQEFVQSDYAIQVCNYCNVNPAGYGQLDVMFDSVQLEGTTLKVKLQYQFEQRAEKLMDRLAKHLRERMPQLRMLQYNLRSDTHTKMIR